MLKILKCNINNRYIFRQLSERRNKEMKYLNVAEKNDAAKTISGLLSNGTARRREGYSVYNKIYDFDTNVKGRNSKMVMTSVSGHLLNLAFPISYRNWNSIDPKTLFDAPVNKTCPEDYAPIKRTLEREIRSCQGLIVWTDCDREGENIGFEIIDVCRAVKPNIPVYRAVFSEITTPAVRRALAQLKQPDKRQSDAVDVRTEMDLRTGAAITRFQTLRLKRLFPTKIADKLISYGSCQIPTLGFVAERYKEIEAFVSEAFWKLKVTHTIDELTVEFNWARNRLFDKQACEDYLLLCLADPKATVESVTVKPKSKWRPTPLDTVEMEKLGSRKLKLSAKEVMTIAEKLYTKGIISYPRTETNQFSKEINLRSLVEQHTSHSDWGSFAQRVMEWGPNPRNGNKSDQAHPPIHPTKLVTNLQGNEARVYELVTRHFLACVSKDATGSETIVNINIAGEKFSANGLCIYERNYLDVYIYDKWNAKQIHNYVQGQIFEPTEIVMHEGATTAPPLLTEADLIALMEKHGIGTDATHAEHINTIKERGYIGVVDKGCLVPGVIGMGLYEGYDAMELPLAKPLLRAEFEADLKKICLGEKDPGVVLREQIQKYKEAYSQIMEKVTAMDAKMAIRINETLAPTISDDNISQNNVNNDWENNPNRVQELFKCPKCSLAPLALKPKKNQSGHFIGCLNFPDCKNVIWWPDECKEPIVLTETCSRCGGNAKLLKFKFNTAYYKTIFTTPSGWYKTCLRCDAQFRDTFNINLENVKRVGAIVSNVAGSTSSTTTSSTRSTAVLANGNSRQAGNSSSGASGSSNANNNNFGNQTKRNNTKKTKTDSNSETKPKNTRKKKLADCTTSDGTRSIRSYYTAAATADEIARNELNGVAIDALFDSNDSFEAAMLTVEEQTAAVNIQTHNVNNINSDNTVIHQPNQAETPLNSIELTDDISALFANDDDDNWGTMTIDTRTTETSYTLRQNQNESNRTSHNNNHNTDDYNWGTASSSRNTNYGATTSHSINSGSISAANRRSSTNRESNFGNSSSTNHTIISRTNPNIANTTSNRGTVATEAPTNFSNYTDDSFSALFRNDDGDLEDYAWGTEAFNRRKSSNPEQPAKRSRLSVTTNEDYCWGDDDFTATWDDDKQQPQTLSGTNKNIWPAKTYEHSIKCSGCHQIANDLVVKKDGPNKGRQFYVCPKSNSPCKFFQWADEITQTDIQSSNKPTNSQRSSSSSGTAHISSNNNNNHMFDINDREPTVNCNCGNTANRLTVRKEGPNKGRFFYACTNRDKSCGFFQWADENDNQASTSTAVRSEQTNNFAWGSAERSDNNNTFAINDAEQSVNCNCGNAAKRLTVHKEGPNKGRLFFACTNRDKSCGFFQWAEENDNQASTSTAARRGQTWGSAGRTDTLGNARYPKTSGRQMSEQSGENRKRKCGLCRQEGHTRQKCPRKNEFEF